jgi:hypothetical protein
MSSPIIPTTTPPNLLLIGAEKGGSTSLFTHLKAHPEIATYGLKEPNIFTAPTAEQAVGRLNMLSLSDQNTTYRLDGSVTNTRIPQYKEAPKNINAICGPQSRFIYILRNPVERLISHFFWKKQRFGGLSSIDRIFDTDMQYYYSSCYDIQIEGYLKYFEKENFFFVLYEDFIKDQNKTAREIFDWLELPPLTAKTEAVRGATKKETTREMKGGALLDPLWRQRWLRDLAKRLVPIDKRQDFMRLFTVERPRVDPTREEKRALLHDRFLDSIARTEALTGLDLGVWRTAYD